MIKNAWVHLHPVALLQLHAMHSPFIKKKNVYTWIEEKNLTTQFVWGQNLLLER